MSNVKGFFTHPEFADLSRRLHLEKGSDFYLVVQESVQWEKTLRVSPDKARAVLLALQKHVSSTERILSRWPSSVDSAEGPQEDLRALQSHSYREALHFIETIRERYNADKPSEIVAKYVKNRKGYWALQLRLLGYNRIIEDDAMIYFREDAEEVFAKADRFRRIGFTDRPPLHRLLQAKDVHVQFHINRSSAADPYVIVWKKTRAFPIAAGLLAVLDSMSVPYQVTKIQKPHALIRATHSGGNALVQYAAYGEVHFTFDRNAVIQHTGVKVFNDTLAKLVSTHQPERSGMAVGYIPKHWGKDVQPQPIVVRKGE